MKKLILFLLLVSHVSYGQSKDGIDLCLALQGNKFNTDTGAENALDRILSVVGLKNKNFSIVPCDNISNAMAISYKGERYILYDKEFMRVINLRTNDWSSLTILAHEVGHHLNNHALDLIMFDIIEPKTLATKRKQELEADEFAGFIMGRLGAPLSEVKNAIILLSNDNDDTFSTHPSRIKRLNAINIGWNDGASDFYDKKIVEIIEYKPIPLPTPRVPKKEKPRVREDKGLLWIYAGIAVATIIAVLTIKRENPDQYEYDQNND